jgi:hypothetical protein
MVKVGVYRFPAFTDFISMFQKKNHVLKYIFFVIDQNLPKKDGYSSSTFPENCPQKGGKGGKGVLPPPVLTVHDFPKKYTTFTAFSAFFPASFEKCRVFLPDNEPKFTQKQHHSTRSIF